jgi:hypothetical protein
MSKNAEKSLEEFINMAKKNVNEAVSYNEFESDNGKLAKSIYKQLFDFYCEENFSGDVIFTWKSASLVKDGVYIGKRDSKVENEIVIGNIFPNYKTDSKYSLNCNRNGLYGSFPHDYFDIYLTHIAKYAYDERITEIKEYYPLKRSILYEENKKYFDKFNGFNDFLTRNYLEEIWEESKKRPFSDIEYEEFKEVSINLIRNRGIKMLNKLCANQIV